MKEKARVLIIDVPWSFKDDLTMSNVKRGAKSNYKSVLKLEDVKKLPVKDVADPDGAVLALWVPSSMLQDGLDVMKIWGFEMKQTFIWVKTKKNPLIKLMGRIKKLKKNFDLKSVLSLITDADMNEILDFNMGRLFRQTHEICLIGVNSKKIYKQLKNKSQRSVCFGSNEKHSAKPEDLHEALEKMFPDSEGRRLELFGRREKEGWVVLGNEIGECLDIRESLPKLIVEIEKNEEEKAAKKFGDSFVSAWDIPDREEIPVLLAEVQDMDWKLEEDEKQF